MKKKCNDRKTRHVLFIALSGLCRLTVCVVWVILGQPLFAAFPDGMCQSLRSAVAGRDTVCLTLSQTIAWAQTHSPEAQSARHIYLSAYWNYRFYKANYLPSLTLSSYPELNRQINRITQSDGTERYVNQNLLNTDLNLTLNQNVWFTGGSFFVTTSARRTDVLSDGSTAYNTSPLTIGYQQSLLGYNSLKWDRRIEPLRLREARKTYAESLELVASQASSLFFRLAGAQTNLDIARSNYASADTLQRYAAGRYRIGTITQNEMMQLEVNRLNEETNCMDALVEVESCMQDLLLFLGMEKTTRIRVLPPIGVPDIYIPEDEALRQAWRNSPEPDALERRLIEQRSSLAQAKADAGLKADLYMKFGLSQTGETLDEAYRRPLNQQYVSLSLSLPVLDWGRGRGRVKVARSQLALTETQVEQSRVNFELNVLKMVRQFNLQGRRVQIAARTDSTAARRTEVARRLYLNGQSTLLDFNEAVAEKDAARRSFISALQTYWSLYYGLRSFTGYDFASDRPIEYTLPEH